MAHPLDGAFLRVSRAEEHLTDLKTRAKAWEEEQRNGIIPHLQETVMLPAQSTAFIGYIDIPRKPIPGIFSVIVGEIIYNMRSALDYLIFELARLESGAEQERTQFPIFRKAEDFQSRAQLKGVSPKHRAALEAMQPYNRGQWLQTLDEISNQDKHRKLYSVIRRPVLTSEPHELPAQINEPTHVHMKLNVAILITFADGSLVIPTLDALKSQVAQTLEAFKPEF